MSPIEPAVAAEPAPVPARAAARQGTTSLALAAAVVGFVLLLAGLATTIDRSTDGSGSESAPRSLDDLGQLDDLRRWIDFGDGQELKIDELPGCEGAVELNDSIIIAPDPEACGFEPVEPGSVGRYADGRIILVPDANGDIGGFRFGPDGIEFLPPGAAGAGDFLIGQLPDGSFGIFDLDGSLLQPGDGSGFDLPDAPSFDDFDRAPDGDVGDLPLGWILGVLGALLVIGAVLYLFMRGRAGRDADDTPDDGPVVYAVEIDALERLLWEIEQDQDPRRAIRRAYAVLESGQVDPRLARRDHETPHVYLDRILAPFEGLAAPLYTLGRLFERARFSEHPITEEMRSEAVRAVLDVRNALASASLERSSVLAEAATP